MVRASVAVWLGVAMAAAGCASTCSLRDDRSWRELSTTNFRLRTDLGDEDARATLAELETMRAALLTTFRAPVDTRTGQVSVVVVDDGWNDIGGHFISGIFTTALYTQHIAMRAGSGLVGMPLVKHELVHYLSRFVRRDEPAWLAEGLAMYFETLEIDDDQRVVTVGRPDPTIVRMVQNVGRMPVRNLRAGRDIHDPFRLFYPSAWLLVHYLTNHHNDAFRAYQSALARRQGEPAAWSAAFGQRDFDMDLRNYVDGGRYYVYKFPFSPPAFPVTGSRAIPAADAHALRALLYTAIAPVAADREHQLAKDPDTLRACARQELAAALRDDEDHTLALAVQTWELGEPAPLDRVESSAIENPDDWMAWWLLASALRGAGDRQRADEAAGRAAALAAGNPAIELDAVVRRH